jgi:acyl carrier protein
MPEQPDAGLAAKVMAVIAKSQRISVETVTLDSTFVELKIDSLDGINIVFALENEFAISIPDEGVQSLRSVRETVEGITRLLAEKAAREESANHAPPVPKDDTA